MNPASIDIKDMLVAESSLGLIFATNLFIGKEPAKPDNCVTIYDTPGFAPQVVLNGQGTHYEYPSVQISIRDRNYANGWQLAQDIMLLLHNRGNETWNGTLYTVINCTSGPTLLEWDDNGNACFIINFNLQRR